jgi:dipeptidyl aminopeptidase/acylaminoacyl peptidase
LFLYRTGGSRTIALIAGSPTSYKERNPNGGDYARLRFREGDPMKHRHVALMCLFFLLAPATALAQEKKRPITVEDFFRLERVSDPQISPDGRYVAYVVTTVDLSANKASSNLRLASADGKTRRQLTTTLRSDRHPRWSPDGKRILFQSNRSGALQLWVIDVGGGEARQLTTISTGAHTGTWSRDGKHIAFQSSIWPEYSTKPFKESDALNQKRMDEQVKNPVKAKVHTRLFYRHWDEYTEDKREHLFVCSFDGDKAGEPRDVTPGDYDAAPTSSTFSLGDDFTFSPDGNYLVYTATPKRNEAWSTNFDIWRVRIDGTGAAENLTKDNKAADATPRFSPDGKHLAYRAQKRHGFESDLWELMVVECSPDGSVRGKPRSVSASVDSWVDGYVWFADSRGLYFTAEKAGRGRVWSARLDTVTVDALEPHPAGTTFALSLSQDGKRLAFLHSRMGKPTQVFALDLNPLPSPARNLSQLNAKLLAGLDLPNPESVTVKGADGTPMQMWILKPPGFDPSKRWPVVFWIHGGPQAAWLDRWSWGWNPQLWAAQGYVMVLPNPRGSTGFGQKYTDEISGDWGGRCFQDLLNGVAYIEKQPWIDPNRMAAAGASFGGYMMNWFQGNTTKFKTLIAQCSIYNLESMFAGTEELWFVEWDLGGLPWGKDRKSYEKFSPHRLAHNFKTPELIFHGDLDYRVPVGEAHQLFTTLRRLGIDARFVNYPDEGHPILRPANVAHFHREVFAWLKKYLH